MRPKNPWTPKTYDLQNLPSMRTCIAVLFAISVLMTACKKDDDTPPTLPGDPMGINISNIRWDAFTVNWGAMPDVTNFLLYVATDTGFTKPLAGFNPKAVTGNSQVVD